VNAHVWLVLILFLAICLGAGGLGSFFTSNSVRNWYPRLTKPRGTPPSWVFGPVWTTLYILMAISAWLVWRNFGWGARPALLIFCAQLCLNVAWSAIFFGSRLPGAAFAEILVLWLAIAFNIFVFYLLLPAAAWLLAPYLVWVSYAAYLNGAIWRLNRSRG